MTDNSAVIIGAGGGIGRAMADLLEQEGSFSIVHRLMRSDLDLTNESSIITSAIRIASGPAPALVFVTTGLLHSATQGPEKSMAALDPDWLIENYRINCVGPALVAKHFLPIMSRSDRMVFAALSARVGSITDNRMGGWHGYRAAKAALHMMIRNLAIEQSRKNSRSIVVALHPGTVDTGLSKPFQGNVAPGKLFAPDRAAVQLLDVIEALSSVDTGQVFAWDGEKIAP